MKPTQHDIVDLAREAHHELVTIDYPGHIAPLDPWTMRLCERFATLLLEHYGAGAGGGDPAAFMVETESAVMTWPAKDYDEALTYCAVGELPINLYTRPSPTQPAQRVMLTDEEIEKTFKDLLGYFMTPTLDDKRFARAVIEAYEIKNGLKP